MAKPQKSSKFKYRLETLLKVRNIREKQAKDKFSAAQKKLDEEKQKEDQIKNFQNQKYSELREIMTGGTRGDMTDMHQVMARKAHLEVVAEQVIEQEKQREDAEEKKEDERKNVVKAVKSKRIIEIDKDKRKGEWRKLMNKEEAKFLDEISSIAFVKKRRDRLEEEGSLD
jgi:flagellar export protein FliJ